MQIIYNDGGVLTCSRIEISGNKLYADDMYIVSLDDVQVILDDSDDMED